jgi:hypothetical protein
LGRNKPEIDTPSVFSRRRNSPVGISKTLNERTHTLLTLEEDVTASVLPIISGKTKNDRSVARDILLGNLEPLTDGGLVHNFLASRTFVMVLVLNNSPSPQEYTSMLPNFFVETKGSDGSTAAVNRQACCDEARGGTVPWGSAASMLQ